MVVPGARRCVTYWLYPRPHKAGIVDIRRLLAPVMRIFLCLLVQVDIKHPAGYMRHPVSDKG